MKKYSKLLALTMCFIVTAMYSTPAFAATASVSSDTSECEHEYGAWGNNQSSDKDATCEEDGQESRICTLCGNIETQVIEKLGHDYDANGDDKVTVDDAEVTPATCETAGKEVYTCQRCKKTDEKTLEALGHDWAAEATTDKEATCTEDGQTSIHCNRDGCKATKDKKVIDKLGHTPASEGIIVEKAACEKNAVYETTCSACGETYRYDKEGTALSHDYDKDNDGDVDDDDAEITAATCVTPGKKVYTCKKCNATKEVEIPELGHEWATEPTVDKAATCTEDGQTSIHCTREGCNAVKEDSKEVIPKLDHKAASEGKIVEKAACEKNAVYETTCDVCDATYTYEKEGTALSHNPAEDYTTDVEATCTDKGSESKHCTVCGASIKDTERAIEATGHDYEAVTTPATCEAAGKIVYTCKKCNATKEEAIPELGHDWATEPTVDKAATCTEDGQTSIHCNREGCNAVKEDSKEVIPKLGHTAASEGIIVAKATCEKGTMYETTCKVCDATYTYEKEGTALGHKSAEDYTTDVEPTCTDKGSESKHCTVCGAIIKDTVKEIEATGHDFEVEGVKVAPTCTEDGYFEFACANGCGEVRKVADAEHKALGHDYATEFTTDKEATCMESGSKSKHCSRCDAKAEVTEIPAKGHVWPTEYTVDEEATCTMPGLKSIHCTACDAQKPFSSVATPALGHAWNDGEVTTVASCTTDGVKTFTCGNCGEKKTEAIPATGHTWKHYKKAAGNLVNGTEYDYCTVCKAKKNVKTLQGYSKITVKSFKVSASKKAFTAKWAKASKTNQKKMTGYQVRYSTKSSMSGAKYVTASKSSKSKKISKLSKKKKYYVQVRTYTKVNGVTFYSSWSAKKSVKTK